MPNRKRLLQVIHFQTTIAQCGPDLEATLAAATQLALQIAGAQGAAVEMVDGEELVYVAAAGTLAPALGTRLAVDHSLSGLCMEGSEALLCADAQADTRVNAAACAALGIRSMVVVPLLHLDRPVGVLKVTQSAPDRFGADELQLLDLLSGALGSAMHFASSQADLFERATHDLLTGLPNRALFLDRLALARSQALRDGGDLGVVMVDVNDLKPVNDRHGHQAGDALLRAVAEGLRAGVRAEDTVARLGGDEFGLLCANWGAIGDVRQWVQRLRQAARSEIELPGGERALTSISLGWALMPSETVDADAALHLADQRMYADKREQKGGEMDGAVQSVGAASATARRRAG